MSQACLLCAFWDGERCTHTWRLVMLVTPVGGQIDVIMTPGMIPEPLKDKFIKYLTRFLEKVMPAVEAMPIWDEIREYQLANAPVTEACPGREIRSDIRPYLKVVK